MSIDHRVAEEPTSLEGGWDLTSFFPELGGDAYRAFVDELERDLAECSEAVAKLSPPPEGDVAGCAALLARIESAGARAGHVLRYVSCLGAADARDEAVQTEGARAKLLEAELSKLWVALRAMLRAADDGWMERLLARPELAGAAHLLSRERERARRMMPDSLEALAADLAVTGLAAWGRLYDRISGELELDLEVAGQPPRRLPVAMTRTLLEDPEPDVRRAALRGANAAWQRQSASVSACLNAIAGTRLALYRRRGIQDPLEPALFDAGISRVTLETMMEVVRGRRELPRRFLRHKAQQMGVPALGFEDLLAPAVAAGAANAGARIPFARAKDTVLEAFGRFDGSLRALAERAFARRWVDYAPRPGKRPGGFCATSKWIGESRIFMTYHGTPGDVSTLAHELGHAFHSHVLRDVRPWASSYPMTLAETASTFAEALLIDHLIDAAESASTAWGAARAASLLDQRLHDAAIFLLNIPMRLSFERALYAERAHGELPVTRLCELMCDAQREWYGDALDPTRLDPWFWASKLHFYITEISFYNFPYTFGYLLSLGLFAQAKRDGPAFAERYRCFLAESGGDAAEAVALRTLGVDLQAPAFWNASVDLIEVDLTRLEALHHQDT